jgi:hypothetical protein
MERGCWWGTMSAEVGFVGKDNGVTYGFCITLNLNPTITHGR